MTLEHPSNLAEILSSPSRAQRLAMGDGPAITWKTDRQLVCGIRLLEQFGAGVASTEASHQTDFAQLERHSQAPLYTQENTTMNKADQDAPEIMSLTANLNDESMTQAEPKAGMFLLFLISGLTMLGSLTGMILFASYLDQRSSPHWLIEVLMASVLGGSVGCGFGMLALGFEELVGWERREHVKEKAAIRSKQRQL